jgi:hypothetical protein
MLAGGVEVRHRVDGSPSHHTTSICSPLQAHIGAPIAAIHFAVVRAT